MMRPPILPHASSSSSGRDLNPYQLSEAGKPALAPLLAELSVYVVPAKLDVGAIVSQIDALGGERALRPEDAQVVVTALRGRPRLARVLGDAVDTVPVLRAEFISDAHQRAVDAEDWESSSKQPSLPRWDDYRLHLRRRSASMEGGDSVNPSTPKRPRTPLSPSTSPPAKKRRTGLDTSPASQAGAHSPEIGAEHETDEALESKPTVSLEDDVAPYPAEIPLESIPRLAVERPSPMTCINQNIIEAIKPIYLEREYDELGQLNSNVLSYRRSMAILKSVPRRITSGKEARTLVDVGAKVANRIDEYLTTGAIAEAESIKASSRFKTLRLFSSVWSVGHSTAAELYRAGCRDLEDVRAFFVRTDPPPPADPEDRAAVREERARNRRREEGTMTREEVVGTWLELKDELDVPIPRDEVQEIAACVAEHLEALAPGCQQTITGGYRRGKASTSDVDIVFRPPAGDDTYWLLKALRRRLTRFRIITHVLQMSSRETGTPLHHGGGNFDNLDKAFVIFRLPGPKRLHRRVDLICAPPTRYAAAVLSWSGSMMFERDLRRWAEDRGYKFRAGLIEITTNREVNFETERDIFRFLGLRYVPPELRNADG